jgi:hypothetical protein
MYECSLLKWSAARSFYGIWTMYRAWLKLRECYKKYELDTLHELMGSSPFFVSSVFLVFYVMFFCFVWVQMVTASLVKVGVSQLITCLFSEEGWSSLFTYVHHSLNFKPYRPYCKVYFNPWQDNSYVQRNSQYHGIHCNVRDGSKPEWSNSWKHVV